MGNIRPERLHFIAHTLRVIGTNSESFAAAVGGGRISRGRWGESKSTAEEDSRSRIITSRLRRITRSGPRAPLAMLGPAPSPLRHQTVTEPSAPIDHATRRPDLIDKSAKRTERTRDLTWLMRHLGDYDRAGTGKPGLPPAFLPSPSRGFPNTPHTTT